MENKERKSEEGPLSERIVQMRAEKAIYIMNKNPWRGGNHWPLNAEMRQRYKAILRHHTPVPGKPSTLLPSLSVLAEALGYKDSRSFLAAVNIWTGEKWNLRAIQVLDRIVKIREKHDRLEKKKEKKKDD